MSDSEWSVDTIQGELRISQLCAQSFPCQHWNSMHLHSVAIWRLIKKTPSIQQTHPDIWEHFSCYDSDMLTEMGW